MSEHILTDDEKAMYLMLLDWYSGVFPNDNTKHYVVGQRYWNHPDRSGWHLTLDQAFKYQQDKNA